MDAIFESEPVGSAELNGSPSKRVKRSSSEIGLPSSPFSPSTDRGDEMTGVSDVEAIRVVCRFRPTSDIELAHGRPFKFFLAQLTLPLKGVKLVFNMETTIGLYPSRYKVRLLLGKTNLNAG